MKRLAGILAVLGSLFCIASAMAWCQSLSVCDYESPESFVSGLSIQGSFSWFDGPYADDRSKAFAASLVADYGSLRSSEASAKQLDARADVRGKTDGWSIQARADGSLLGYFDEAMFAVGAFGVDAVYGSGLEVDLTVGGGSGRFRDVTPLAQSILVQNGLLDQGELLAPLANETLQDLAAILGEIGPTDAERIILLAQRLEATDLLLGEELGVRGLLEIERVLEESGANRLCGHDVQARIGLAAMLLPELRLSSTGIIESRFASVPDPVSQMELHATAQVRLAHIDQLRLEGSATYSRSLPEGWRARGEYHVELDRMWTNSEETVLFQEASASLTTVVFGSVGLSLVGQAEYRTGDEEITFALSVYLEADLF